MPEKLIAIAHITDPEWNSRLYDESSAEKKEIEDLADSMAKTGQLQAIRVEQVDKDSYMLVIGSRRLRAAKVLLWDQIRADVNPPSDPTTRTVQNIVENVKRKDLSQYEQARACVKLRELGLKGDEIGERLGFSKQKVSNLAVSFTQLPPEIVEEWRKGHPAATVDFLRKLVSDTNDIKDETERVLGMKNRWDERVELLDEAEELIDPPPPAEQCKSKVGGKRCTLDIGHEGDHKPPRETPDPPMKVSAQRYFDLGKAVRKSKIAGGTLVLECMKYLVGEVDKVKGVIEPGEEEDASS